MITEEQRQERKKGIFASDVNRIMDGKAVQLALEKLDEIEIDETEEDPIEIEVGYKLENQILDAYEQQTETSLIRSPDTMRHKEHTYLGAHLDAIEPMFGIAVEAKSVGYYRRHLWGEGSDEVPANVLWQCQTQMMVSSSALGEEIKEAHVPVCFLTDEAMKYLIVGRIPPIKIYRIPADAELQAYIVRRTQPVWDCIKEGKLPPAELPIDTQLIYRRDNGLAIEATEEALYFYSRINRVREVKSKLEQHEAQLVFQLQNFMKESSAIQFERETLVTWKNDAPSRKFDAKAFQKKHPKLWEKFQKPKEATRRFIVKKRKPKELTD